MIRAGFWWRTLAATIDGVIIIAAVMGLVLVIVWVTGDVTERAGDFVGSVLVLLYTSTEMFTRGTPGKLMLRMRITRQDGEPADPATLFLRWSAKQSPSIFSLLFAITQIPVFTYVSGISGLVVFIGCLVVAGESKLAWHDQWAKTAVMRKVPSPPQGFPVELLQQAAPPPQAGLENKTAGPGR